MRLARLFVLLAVLVVVAGCDSDSGGGDRESAQTEGMGIRSPEGLLIRDWLQALNGSDYGRAAGFFAPNALVDQGNPVRLPNRAAARFFNASLPCRADLVRLVDEGRKVLASFRLRPGPGGPCSGIVKVRFLFDGEERFSEFRQLPGEGGGPREENRPGEEV